LAITPDATWNEFVSQIRNNLHLVLCFSPVGDAFRRRCRMFPSLINCCTIDWYSQWPKQALLSVSHHFLSELADIEEETKQHLSQMCQFVHASVHTQSERFYAELRRKVYTTPKSYLDMIALYIGMLSSKRQELGARRNTLCTGLTKLEGANKTVATLQEELKALQPQLVSKQQEATQLLSKIAVDQAEADAVKERVEAEAQIVEKQAEETRAVQQDAQNDLDRALPALEAASNALKALNKSDITEVKSMAKPPAGVVMVLEAVMILLKEKTSWDNAKKVMASVSFLSSLQEFDKDHIAQKTVEVLKKKYTSDVENFSVERMQKVSVAATALCKWVHAMVLYSEVSKTVEPKRQRLQQMNAELDKANAELTEKRTALQRIVDKVDALKKQCDATLAEKQQLEFESNQCLQRLERAEKLTVGLAAEQVRWSEQEKMLQKQISDLVGDVFIAAAFVSYAGPFTGEYRQHLVSQWMNNECFSSDKIAHSDLQHFSFVKLMGNAVQIKQWTDSYGLPSDEVSIESAIISRCSERWPLMIDPQNQAKQWIKNMERNGGKLHCVKMDDANLLRVLEVAVRNGEALLIEDIGEHLDAALDSILNRAVFKSSGGRLLIRLGDSDIDYDPGFRLYISTKLSNPHYLPEVAIKVTLINFTVTRHGLSEQLLADVVKHERPEIDEKRTLLIAQMAEDKAQLQHIEETILKLLSESVGNILDDVQLIDTLQSSKQTSAIIKQRVADSELTEQQIEETRSKYRCVAQRASILFFVISSMALIDPMYQYSLSYFAKLFNSIIENAAKSDELEQRLQILQTELTAQIYTNICRGLFERHKLIFSFLIGCMIQLHSQRISQSEWMYFLRGSNHTQQASPALQAISSKAWNDALDLEHQFDAVFGGLTQNLVQQFNSFWRSYFDEENAWKSAADNNAWMSKLSHFQRLMLLKALKPEKVQFGIAQFVEETLGAHFVSLPPTKLQAVFRDTDKTTPIIFVLSTGADPQSVLQRFAKEMGYFESRLHVLSLGQGQGVKAEKLLQSAMKQGHWLCLQNCHLAKSWMPHLEKLVIAMDEKPESVHADFRLWLTSMPCDYFPVPVLQNGVKLTNEPPRGIRANLMRSYASLSQQDLELQTHAESESEMDVVYRRLLFTLSFFHAVIQERRKFGALGFNKAYEFNDSDLETSMTILRMFVSEIAERAHIPWQALRYVIGQINYGGRVTDDWDRRCLMTILDSYYTRAVLDAHSYSLVKESSDDSYRFSDGALTYYKQYIERLPLHDDPRVFGMHQNANITHQAQESNTMIDTILSIQPRNPAESAQQNKNENEDEEQDEAAKPKTQDEMVSDLAAEILASLPAVLDMKDGEQTFMDARASTQNGMMDSLTIFLVQECEKFNRLLTTVSSTLQQLQAAIIGQVVMSATLDDIYNDLLNNKVPSEWKKVCYPSLKPLKSWIVDLNARLSFIGNWLLHGKPHTYWMSAFFFQQGFITGILQNHARKYKLAIDSLSFEFVIRNHEYSPQHISSSALPTDIDGVLVYGMYLDGAKWNDSTGTLQDANIGELYYKMPIIHFVPTQQQQHHKSVLYECPLYKTSVRAGVLSTTGQSTNYILPIHLPTPADKDHTYWIKRGVALLTQLND